MTEDMIHGVYSGEGDDWDLELEFDTKDPEFIRGFCCGQIWELLDYGMEEVESVITPSNIEMAIRMAEAKGYDFTGHDSEAEGFDAELITVVFKKKNINRS